MEQGCLGSNPALTVIGSVTGGKVLKPHIFFLFLSFFPIYWFICFPYVPTAYGGSQARGRIRATAARLHHSHSNARSKPRLWPTLSSRQCQILNPLSEARHQTHNPLDTLSGVRYYWAAMGTPLFSFSIIYLSGSWTSIHMTKWSPP